MKLILGRLRRFALLLSIASAGFAQMPANVAKIQADAQAVLQSPAATKLFPSAPLEFPHFDALPSQIEVSDEQLFRVLQYIRAQRPSGLGVPQAEAFLKHVLADTQVSREEAIILEAFARSAPLTVAFVPADERRKPMPLIPALDAAGIARLRQLQSSAPVLTTAQIIQTRYLEKGRAAGWLELYRSGGDSREIALAAVRLAYLRFRPNAQGSVVGEYPIYQGMKDWVGAIDFSVARDIYKVLHDDLVALNDRYPPALFPPDVLKYLDDASKPPAKP